MRDTGRSETGIRDGTVVRAPAASAISRRRVVSLLAVACAGLGSGACLPLARVTSRSRLSLAAHPATEDKVLRAFVDAVVPGLDARTMDSPYLSRPFVDPDLPFHPFHLDLTTNLCERSLAMVDNWSFYRLDAKERRSVIRAGLEAGGLTTRLYEAAIFIAQVSAYAGIYDDDAGCPLIDFEGAAQRLDWAEMSYPHVPGLFASAGDLPGGQPN